MALTKVTEKGIKDESVTTENVKDGDISNVDLSPSAAIDDSKLATITSSIVAVSALTPQPGSSSVFLSGARTYGAIDTSLSENQALQIGLLGFKMAVNESLTVFNLLDGVVDEFHDESGTDESESSNDFYCASEDRYINATQPGGVSVCTPYSAGFSMTAITEPDTSTAGTNPASHPSSGSSGEFTVPSCITSVDMKVWGSGGGGPGGGGGYVEGTLAVTAGQKFEVLAGEGGNNPPGTGIAYGGFYNGGQAPAHPGQSHGGGGGGGGLSGIFADSTAFPGVSTPQVYLIAGSGGGGGHGTGGAGGGLGGDRAGETTETTSKDGGEGGGGDQEQGGQGADGGGNTGAQFEGAPTTKNDTNVGAGGAGFYGGGGGGHNPGCGSGRGGGGGSSYIGHPQITSGSTEEGSGGEGGGVDDPAYVACTNEGGPGGYGTGEDGYVLFTANYSLPSTTTSTNIISTAFSAGSVPTKARIVVFEEDVATPTLNTDIIAQISRDGGSTYTNATLTDAGYVTGSSGQRILTGQATISGQPSGQSMRWKIALANNAVKIHGVSLSWA